MENKDLISINQYRIEKMSKDKEGDIEYLSSCKSMIIALLEEIIDDVERGEWTSVAICLSSENKRNFEYTSEDRSFGNLCAALDMCKMDMFANAFYDEE